MFVKASQSSASNAVSQWCRLRSCLFIRSWLWDRCRFKHKHWESFYNVSIVVSPFFYRVFNPLALVENHVWSKPGKKDSENRHHQRFLLFPWSKGHYPKPQAPLELWKGTFQLLLCCICLSQPANLLLLFVAVLQDNEIVDAIAFPSDTFRKEVGVRQDSISPMSTKSAILGVAVLPQKLKKKLFDRPVDCLVRLSQWMACWFKRLRCHCQQAQNISRSSQTVWVQKIWARYGQLEIFSFLVGFEAFRFKCEIWDIMLKPQRGCLKSVSLKVLCHKLPLVWFCIDPLIWSCPVLALTGGRALLDIMQTQAEAFRMESARYGGTGRCVLHFAGDLVWCLSPVSVIMWIIICASWFGDEVGSSWDCASWKLECAL